MAQLVAAPQAPPWWSSRPDLCRRLEADGYSVDATLKRLDGAALERNPDLRRLCEGWQVAPAEVLAYEARAENQAGRFRLVALMPEPPPSDPVVVCLDGPRGADASPHRHTDIQLCLYHPDDPPEQRWTLGQGVLALFDLARRHLLAEYFWRKGGRRDWPIAEAPHNRAPRPAGEKTARGPTRNDPCPCGSGRKWKRCCMP